jgi:hypothetical protein
MKALSRAILAMLILLPLSLSAHPAKGPKNKKKKGGSKAVVTETVVVKKGKKKHGKAVVVKKNRRSRRGRSVVVHVRPSMSDWRFERLIRRLHRAHGPAMKLELVVRATERDWFSVDEARLILREFRSQRVRLEALDILSNSIVDRRKLHRLLRAFEGRKAKRSAALILADASR